MTDDKCPDEDGCKEAWEKWIDNSHEFEEYSCKIDFINGRHSRDVEVAGLLKELELHKNVKIVSGDKEYSVDEANQLFYKEFLPMMLDKEHFIRTEEVEEKVRKLKESIMAFENVKQSSNRLIEIIDEVFGKEEK